MCDVFIRVVLALTLSTLSQQQGVPPTAQADELAQQRAEIDLLCAAAIDDLRFLDRNRLSEEDRKTFDHVGDLVSRAQLYLKERTQSGVFSGALSQAREAATQAGALVRKYLKLDEYERIADQYRSGDAGAVRALSRWLSTDLERLTEYLEASGVRGTRSPGDAISPAAGEFTSRIIATCVLLHTQAAFESVEPGPDLRLAGRLMRLLSDVRLPHDFRRQWYVAVAGHLQGQLNLLGAVTHVNDAVSVFPTDADILVAAGGLYELLASPTTVIPRQTALRTATSDVTSMGNTREVMVQRTLMAIRENRSQARNQAEEFYRKAIAAAPDCAEAHLRLGRLLHLSGHPDAALKEIRLAAKSDDKRIRYLAGLFAGATDESRGHVTEAVADYRTAMRECPACLTGGIALSHALRRNGDLQEAAEILDAALEREKVLPADDPWWDYPLGNLWRRDRIMQKLLASLQ